MNRRLPPSRVTNHPSLIPSHYLLHWARNEGFRLMPTASARKGSLCFQHDPSSARHSKQASSALAPLKGSRFAVKACHRQAFSPSLVRICNPHLVIFRISNPSSPAFHSTSDGNCSQRKCWRIANPDSISCWIANPTQRSFIVLVGENSNSQFKAGSRPPCHQSLITSH